MEVFSVQSGFSICIIGSCGAFRAMGLMDLKFRGRYLQSNHYLAGGAYLPSPGYPGGTGIGHICGIDQVGIISHNPGQFPSQHKGSKNGVSEFCYAHSTM